MNARRALALLGALIGALLALVAVTRDTPPRSDTSSPEGRRADPPPREPRADPSAVSSPTESASQESRGSATPMPTTAERAQAYAPWDEPAPPLRGVRGIVRDAVTGQPIEGAWIAWRLPPPAVADRVLGDPGFRDARFTMLSDARGRFSVERLPDDAPLSYTLFAVARGYAYASQRVGLKREVAFGLLPAGCIEVVVRGAGEGPPEVRLSGPGPQEVFDQLPVWGEGGDTSRFTHLAPGAYTVQLDPAARGPEVRVNLTQGQVARVTLQRAGLLPVEGSLSLPGAPLPDRDLALVDVERWTRHEVRSDRFGRFRADLPAGRYAPFLLDGASERRIPGELRAGAAGADLVAQPGDAALTLRVTRGGEPLSVGTLGLVGLDAPLSSLLALAPTDDPGVYAVHGAAGRYALFEDAIYWGELTLPGEASLDLAPRSLRIEFGLGGLEPEEVVRGVLSVVPAAVEERPDLVRRFEEATRVPFTAGLGAASLVRSVGSPGRYVVSGRSDLGPFRAVVEVSAVGESGCTVDLVD